MAFGRLHRDERPAPIGEINVTPLVDVMLVLVVIFLLTAPLLASSIRLDLPRAVSAAAAPSPQAPLKLLVNREGAVFLDDQPIGDAALAARLADAAQHDAATELQLRADAAVPYGRVVALLGLAQKAGLSRIGFMAEAPSPAAPVTDGRKP
ncbi:biopolymer transporter ExbD [uncultured Xylophilus sp.]|uniref:ExbD/TolR family protein n=1 Tax=uncultured Xylophilus sp. TaxID=296832 RepID=UPI0025D58964|nr:biopolymer transporter ExbD [uncultured Xylophilus sp.]